MVKFVDSIPPKATPAGRVSNLVPPDTQEALKAHPGQWAHLDHITDKKMMGAVRSWAQNNPGFKVAERGPQMFMRYVPPTDETTTPNEA